MTLRVPARFRKRGMEFFVHGEGGDTGDRFLDFGSEAKHWAFEQLSDEEYEKRTPPIVIGVASRAFGTDLTLSEMRWVAEVLNAAIGRT